MKNYFIYIIKCSDNSYYTGSTDNLEKRVYEHNFGKFKGYTSNRLPVKLVFSQKFKDPKEAISAERRIKGWSRKKEGSIDYWEL